MGVSLCGRWTLLNCVTGLHGWESYCQETSSGLGCEKCWLLVPSSGLRCERIPALLGKQVATWTAKSAGCWCPVVDCVANGSQLCWVNK
jgi:hypothetical protein